MSEIEASESVKHFLKPHLANRKITSVILEKEDILINITKDELLKKLIDKTIIDFKRRGKILLFLLDDGSTLFIHPRMVGQLITCLKTLPKIKHTHFIMKFDNDEEFRYIDVRRLGKLYYIKKDEEDIYTGINRLGVEYNDESLNVATLKSRLLNYKKTVKDALLDQSLIAGIGNIYADEILFVSKIMPNKKAQELSNEEINRLFHAIKEVLDRYIELNESVGYDEYLKGEGKDFANMHVLRLYHSQRCPICNKELERTKLSSRGTVYCPHCQK